MSGMASEAATYGICGEKVRRLVGLAVRRSRDPRCPGESRRRRKRRRLRPGRSLPVATSVGANNVLQVAVAFEEGAILVGRRHV